MRLGVAFFGGLPLPFAPPRDFEGRALATASSSSDESDCSSSSSDSSLYLPFLPAIEKQDKSLKKLFHRECVNTKTAEKWRDDFTTENVC